MKSAGWAREAISDESGVADIAYISIAGLVVMAMAAVAFLLIMSAVSYANCAPITTVTDGGKGMASVVPCQFDPLPMGQAVGLIFAGFGTLIASLAGYMVATRRRGKSGESVETPA